MKVKVFKIEAVYDIEIEAKNYKQLIKEAIKKTDNLPPEKKCISSEKVKYLVLPEDKKILNDVLEIILTSILEKGA